MNIKAKFFELVTCFSLLITAGDVLAYNFTDEANAVFDDTYTSSGTSSVVINSTRSNVVVDEGVNFNENERTTGLNISGGIVINTTDVGTPASVTFKGNNTFSENKMTSDTRVNGGILRALNGANTSFGNNTVFSNNVFTATTDNSNNGILGGIVNQIGGNISFGDDLVVSGNSSYSYGNGRIDGGQFYLSALTATFGNNATFDSNMAGSETGFIYGGMLRILNSKVTFGDGARFTNNTATTMNTPSDSGGFSHGGAIYISASNNSQSNVTFGNNAYFDNNFTHSDDDIGFGGAIYSSASTGSVINMSFGDGTVFNKNYATTNDLQSGGGAIYFSGAGSKLTFGDNTIFTGNFSEKKDQNSTHTSSSVGGAIYIANATAEFGQGTLFQANENKAAMNQAYGGAIYTGGATTLNFKGDAVFDKNIANSSSGGAVGGALSIESNSTVNFDKSVAFTGNKSTGVKSTNGGAIHSYATRLDPNAHTRLNFNGDALFENNSTVSSASTASGGAVYANNRTHFTFLGVTRFIGNSAQAPLNAANGGALYAAPGSEVIFKNTTEFTGNYTVTADMANAVEAKGAAIFMNGNADNGASNVSFELSSPGQYILFENNKISDKVLDGFLSSIHLNNNLTNLSFNLAEGTYANVRDPITSAIGSNLSKSGAGDFVLWGDNSGLEGNFSIEEGSLYLLFEDEWDQVNDPYQQRYGQANLNNAHLDFADNTIFRPKVNNTYMAEIGSDRNVGNNVLLYPYEISKLDTGTHEYTNDYTGFTGFESDLAKVTPGGTTEIVIKRDLAGYQSLDDFADIFRKDSNLDEFTRYELDELYRTGILNDYLKDLIGLLEGEDYINYEQAHRASVRQFQRQIASRVNNRNCKDCSINNGYNGTHLWFDVSKNWVDKETTTKGLGYEYRPTGFAAGYDYDLIPEKWNLGAAVGYSFGEARVRTADLQSKNEIREYLIALYTKYKPLRAYVSGSIGGGLITNKAELKGPESETEGRYDTTAFFATSEFGYDFGNSCGVFEPYIGLEYTRLRSEGHKEKGHNSRDVGSMSWDILEIPVGLRISRDLYAKDYIYTPSIDVAYARNIGDTGTSTYASFIGGSGAKWKIAASSDKRDSLRGTFNFKINSDELPFALNLGYAIDYRSDYSDNQLYATFRWDF